MNFKLTMTMVTVLLLGLLVLVLLPKAPDKDNISPTDSTPLIADAATKLNIASITYMNGSTLEFKFVKDGESWKMTEPSKATIDSRLVDDIAGSLKSLSYRRKFQPQASGEKSPEATGTGKPGKLLKFTDTVGKEYTLALGKRSTEGTFATLNGEKTIYVLQSSPADQFLDKTADSFRNKQIKQVDTSKVTKLDIKTAKGEIHLTKADGKWLFTSPPARANSTLVEDILKEFANIQAIAFSPLDKKIAGVEPGVVTATAWIDESPATPPSTSTAPASAASQSAPKLTPVTLQLGYFFEPIRRETSSVYASVAGSDDVFTFSRDAFNKINKELKDLRDPAIIPSTVNLTTATDIAVTGDGTLLATRKDNKWTIRTSGNNPALDGDPFAISDYLGLLRDLRAINYADGVGDLKAIGLDPANMKIEITIPGQSQHEVLLVGKTNTDPNGGKVTSIMRQGEPTVYQIQTVDADRLAATMVSLRDKQVQSVSADRIRKIEIAGPAATVGISAAPTTAPAATTSAPASAPAAPQTPGVTLVHDAGNWKVQKGAESVASDESKVSGLLADFTPLVAGKYLADKPPEGTPSITVTLTMLESALPPAPSPATAPAATGTAPATNLADILPSAGPATVDPGKLVTHKLTLYKSETPATSPATQPAATWKAAWDGQSPMWTFEPSAMLIEHVTKTTYNPGPPPSSQPATQAMPVIPQ